MALAYSTSYSGQGPTDSGQVFADAASAGPGSQNLEGVCTITLDGAATAAAIPFIDGIKTLPFTPQGVVAVVTGGTQQAAALVSVAIVSVTNAVVNATLSAAGTNLNTLKVAFRAIK